MMYTNRRGATLSQDPKPRPGANGLKVLGGEPASALMQWILRSFARAGSAAAFVVDEELGSPAGVSRRRQDQPAFAALRAGSGGQPTPAIESVGG